MWGEIDPPVKTQPSSYESEDKSELPEEPATPSPKCDLYRPTESQQPRQDGQCGSQAESQCVNDMVEAIARSGSPVKSQQIGEAELTLEERREELLHQYRTRPLVFLERYHTCLRPQNLPAFAHVCSDPRAQHYSKVIQRRAAACTNRTRVRNQRYAALRALQSEGQYFSEEQMRMREPLLYEQYIGQYLTDDEVLERSQEAMQDGAQQGPGAPAGGTGGLAHLLLNSYQERLIQSRLQEEQEREDGAQEEEDEEDDDNTVQQQDWEPNAEEKALLREEFISQMHQRFLDGKDKDFNYRIMANMTLPNLSEETQWQIISKLQSSGLESKEDLKYVQQEDIADLLPVIQRRKLLDAFKNRDSYIGSSSHSNFVTTDE